ncbi:MAG: transglutaminase-like domain-containing protein [Clostridiales bacterium]|nr:transglutaminase-like domain-containing protein [Clostridiales bacterium]
MTNVFSLKSKAALFTAICVFFAASLCGSNVYASADYNNQLYAVILNGVENCEESIDLTAYDFTLADSADLSDIFFSIRTGNWDLWYVCTDFTYFYTDDGKLTEIRPDYSCDADTVNIQRREVVAAAEDIAAYINSFGKDSPVDKAKILYSYFCGNYTYSYNNNYNDTYSLFTKKEGRCMSMSQGYKAVCDILKIPCHLVVNDSGSHEWAEVYVNFNWYTVDIAAQNNTSEIFK